MMCWTESRAWEFTVLVTYAHCEIAADFSRRICSRRYFSRCSVTAP